MYVEKRTKKRRKRVRVVLIVGTQHLKSENDLKSTSKQKQMPLTAYMWGWDGIARAGGSKLRRSGPGRPK